jgi:hypothetical protein
MIGSSKRKQRDNAVRIRKKKKSSRKIYLGLIVLAVVGFLIFFFVTLFDSVYPPIAHKEGTGSRREKVEVVLYFSDANERFLVAEKRFVPKENSVDGRLREVVRALLEGSKTGLVNTFPEKIALQSVKIEAGDTAVISFDEALVRNHPGGTAAEMATVSSLANTVTTAVEGVKKVKILIDGKERASLKGHVDLRRPFVFQKELLAQAGSGQ